MKSSKDLVKKVGRPKTIVSDKRKEMWDMTQLMPKSLMNRKFYDISALHKISEDGLISTVGEEELLNSTQNGHFDSENLYMRQRKLGRIKLLQTPNSKYNYTSLVGTTDYSAKNKDYKYTDFESTNIEFASKDKSGTPMLPEIQSLKSSTERQNSILSKQSSRHSKNMGIIAKSRRKARDSSADDAYKFKYHKAIFDNYEPLKFNVETGEWIRTDIVRNTRFINIENNLKDRMRDKGRFPIPDPIKKSKEHPRNDENLILRADSLIESAYNTEKGDEFVRNEDFITPGILSPLQSEISMHKVDLYSSSENEDHTNRSTLRHDK